MIKLSSLLEDTKRIAREKGQHKGSSSHSDLYTDENPKGTIHGLKFATVEDAKKSVAKIKSSGKPHAHKIQAAIAMEQRAKAAGKSSAAGVYRTYINSIKKSEITKTNEVEVGQGHENDRDMVVGVAEILRMIDDINNRKEIAEAMLIKFKSEGVIHNTDEFLTLCDL